MPEPGIKLSKTKVSQTIDLNSIIGKDISGDPLLVRKIGQSILDFMLERVDGGRGINGVKLKSPYSKDYSDSLEFNAAGKVKSEVNMRLSGDMLGSVDFSEEDGTITLEIDNPDEAIKAYGHQTGFEGHPTIKGPRRPFFGLSEKEIKIVLNEYQDDIQSLNDGQSRNVEQAEESASIIITVADLFR